MIDVHGLVVALHSLVSSALPGTQVLDGWNRSDDVQSQAVAVALPPVQNAPAIEVRVATDEGGICADQYDVTVHSAASVWDGDEEFTAKRAQVQTMMQAIGDAVDDDPRLGGTVFELSLAPEQEWYQLSDHLGTVVQVDFAFTARVYG